MICDIGIFADNVAHSMIQVQGLEFVPMSQQTAKDDREIFSNVVWDVLNPDAQASVSSEFTTPDHYKLVNLLQRLAGSYLRALDQSIPKDHPSRIEWPYKSLMPYAADFDSLLRAEKSYFWQQQWEQDTQENIAAECTPFVDTIEMKVLFDFGSNLVTILNRDKLPTIQPPLMDDWYTSGLGIANFTKSLIRLLKQIVHRLPRMQTPEIRPERGGATNAILNEIGAKLALYTVTAPSSEFIDLAHENVAFKPSDVSKSLVQQGFLESSYDLVIVYSILHTMPEPEEALFNIRRLLKPGGYLVVLEILPSLNPFFNVVLSACYAKRVSWELTPALLVT